MTTTIDRPASAPGQSRRSKPLIERLNVFTALALGAISAVVVWQLALHFLPQIPDGQEYFNREDKITLLSMVAWLSLIHI